MSSGSLLVAHPKPLGAADRGHEKTPARFPARKSGLPDLRNKKPILGRPGIGAHFVSFNFLNTSFR
jgi:hypothetical protein